VWGRLAAFIGHQAEGRRLAGVNWGWRGIAGGNSSSRGELQKGCLPCWSCVGLGIPQGAELLWGLA